MIIFSKIKQLWQRLFRWGPRNPILRIFWVIGMVCVKPFKHGEEFTRYKMYSDIAGVIEKEGISGSILSISRSSEICKYIKGADVFEADYPEYNWLNLPFPDESFDAIVSDMVIEHIEGEPQAVVDESRRLLKKGGYLIITTNFIYPWHGCPNDLWRFTQSGLLYLCRKFSSTIASGEAGNAFFVIMRWLGLHKLPVPHSKYHPVHWLACNSDHLWAMVTWVVAKK